MKARLTILAAAIVVASAVPVVAHHSFAAEYDRSKPIKFTGTVTKVEWMNPHIYYYVDVKDQSGKTGAVKTTPVPSPVKLKLLKATGVPLGMPA